MSASYAYDYQGERIKKMVGGVETGYLYQAEDIIKETSGGTVTDYLHGIGIDDPVYLDRSGTKSYYFGDGLGSIREMTDATGTIKNSYSYGAWGELRASSVTVANSYGYTGREFAEEGLYFYRARYLDTGIGRFILKDPIGIEGGINLYNYVKNNPIQYMDPFGLKLFKTGICEADLKDCLTKVAGHHLICDIGWTEILVICEMVCSITRASRFDIFVCLKRCTEVCSFIKEIGHIVCMTQSRKETKSCIDDYNKCKHDEKIRKIKLCIQASKYL